MAKRGRPVERPGLWEDMLRNEAAKGTPAWLTNDQLAEKFGTTVGYIYRLRARMRDKNIITEPSHALTSVTPRPQRKSRRPATYNPDDPVDLLRLLEDEVILDRSQRLKLLSRIIRLSPPTLKLKAMDQLEDLTKHAENRIGPPPPTSFDGQVAELVGLMLLLPFAVVQKAYETITTPEEEPETPVQPPSDDLRSDEPVPTGEMRDLQGPSGPEPDPDSGPLPSDGADPGSTLPSL